MPSNNTLNQTPDAPSQEGAPENECNHPCGCSQATYLIVEPEELEEGIPPLGYRRTYRDNLWRDLWSELAFSFGEWADGVTERNKEDIKKIKEARLAKQAK